MPDAETAFSEAIQNSQRPADHRWSHAAVREAGRATGWFDLAQASSATRIRTLKSMFCKQYGAVINRVMAGGSVESQALVGHDGQLNPAELAERNGREKAAAEAGARFGHRMSGEQGIAALKGILQ